MVDALRIALPAARVKAVPRSLVLPSKYAILTMHRPGNVDDRERLERILGGIETVATMVPVVFPVHPRTATRFEEFGLWARVKSMRGLMVLEPLGYLDFLSLLDRATLAITDSGGIPEECTYLGIPCLTLRNTTERPDTVRYGINRLVDDDPKKLVTAVKRLLTRRVRRKAPKGWDGRAADRIVAVIGKFLAKRAKQK